MADESRLHFASYEGITFPRQLTASHATPAGRPPSAWSSPSRASRFSKLSQPRSISPTYRPNSSRPVTPSRSGLVVLSLTIFLGLLTLASMYQTTATWAWATLLLPRTTETEVRPAVRERVAVCIAGSARTFRYNMTYRPILHKIVKPLRAAHETDVFFLMRMEDATVTKRRPKAIEDEDATRWTMELFKPKEIQLVTEDLPESRIRPGSVPDELAHFLPPRRCRGLPEEASCRVPDALYRSKQCLEMIARAEVAKGVQYDWVYRMRPDIILFDPVLQPRQLRRDTFYSNQGRPAVTMRCALWWMKKRWTWRAGHGPIADQIGIASREIAESAFRAFDATEDCELYEIPGRIAPEEILRFWVMKHAIRYEAAPFDWAIVREFTGPECKRLFWQHGEGADWRRSMGRCIRYGAAHQKLFPKSDFKAQMETLKNKTRPHSFTLTW